MSRLFALTLTILFAASLARAQQADTALVVGTVVDASDAAVPGATVTLTHLATNTTTDVVSDERGQYRTPPLRLGEYVVDVQLEGFKRFTQRNVVLNIGEVRRVDARLQLGDVAETVTVEAAPPLLQTSDSTVGTVITNQQIRDLPLNGRDYLQLAAISGGTAPTTGVGVSIGGQAGSQVAFLLDGQDNNNQQISTGHSNQKEVLKPSIDAIQEFRIVTNGYAAEYGRSSSGVVSVSLKSGTNALSGSVFEYFRDDALDATNYFATEKPPYRRNQFGGAVGFPLLRNRTFFFGDFERGVLRRSTTTVSTLPSAAFRSGQFAGTIIDPLTGQPFPGNQIPASRIDPVAAEILGYVPLPQTGSATNNYVYNSPNNQDALKWDFRIDHVFNGNQNVYFRYGYQKTDNAVSSPLPPDDNGNYYAGGGNDVSIAKSWVGVYNSVWSSSLISSVRAGWNGIFWDNVLPPQSLQGVGIPGVDTSNPGFSQIAITGYRTLGITNVPNADDSLNRQLSADLTWTRGTHTLKAGLQWYELGIDFLSSQRSSGIFNFNGQYTRNAFADFLLGYASSASVSTYAKLNFRSPYTHLFAQDDWRVSRRLTLNLGLRYELSPPAVDQNDAIANFDLDTDPAHPIIVPAGSEGDNWESRALQGVNLKQFAPRAGFAYTINDSTVLRGGTGMFYSNLITLGGMQSMEINPPNHLRINQTTSAAAPSIFLSSGFPANALTFANARNVTLVSYDRSDDVPTAYQWNVNVQRELPGGVVLDVGYNGNRLVNNWRQIDGNPAPPGPGDINSRRKYTTATVPGTGDVITLANVVRVEKNGWSQYHGVQTKVEKRYSKGVSVLASYTYSRTRALGDQYQDVLNQDAEIAVADTDRPHYFVASGVYELPFGLSLAPILTIASGAPLNLTVNGNPSNTGQNDRPNVVGDWHVDDPTVDQWFNTAAFVASAPYTYGNAPRNLLRGPGTFNLDLVLRKSFRLSDGVTADLRFESFNLTNNPAFGNPNTQVGNPNFGKISSAGAARSHQAAVKLLF